MKMLRSFEEKATPEKKRNILSLLRVLKGATPKKFGTLGSERKE